MPRAILDENASLQIAERLRTLGYDSLAIAQLPTRGMSDQEVSALALAGPSVLITRDAHFTNPLRFPPTKTAGIVYVTHGNLRGRDEADLVAQFLRTHPPEVFAGRLVHLSLSGARIR